MTQTSRGNESHTGSHSNGCRGVVSFHAPPPVGDGPLPGHHCREKAEHLLLNTHSDSSEALAALCRAHCERRAVYARRWRCCSKAPNKPRQCRGTCAAANAPRASGASGQPQVRSQLYARSASLFFRWRWFHFQKQRCTMCLGSSAAFNCSGVVTYRT